MSNPASLAALVPCRTSRRTPLPGKCGNYATALNTRNSVSTAKERTGDQVQAAQFRALPLPLALCGEEHTGGFLALSSLALYFQHQKGEHL